MIVGIVNRLVEIYCGRKQDVPNLTNFSYQLEYTSKYPTRTITKKFVTLCSKRNEKSFTLAFSKYVQLIPRYF